MAAERTVGRSTAPRLTALLLLTVGVLALTVGLAPNASAHATVTSSDPGDSARLATAPVQVSVTFDEVVGLGVGYLRVINSRGADVTTGPATHPGDQGRVIAVGLKPGLGDGTYIASWRVTSSDSHPVAGTIRFVVGNGVLAPAAGSSGPVVSAGTNFALDVARTVSYAALALLGGAWLLLTIWPAGRGDTRARRLLLAGWIAGLVGAAAGLLLQGPYSAGFGLTGIGQLGLLTDTISTNFGRLHLVRLLLLVGLGFVLKVFSAPGAPARPTARLAWLGAAAFLAVVFTFSAAGHAGAATPHWLAVTGKYQAWRESGTVLALITTSYGELILLKVALFIGLLFLGNLSRTVVQRQFVRASPVTVAVRADSVAFVSASRGEDASSDAVLVPVGPGTDLR